MTQPHLSVTVIAIALTAVAGLLYGAFVLYGAWIDGRRQAVREKGMHPVTLPDGHVEAREDEHDAR